MKKITGIKIGTIITALLFLVAVVPFVSNAQSPTPIKLGASEIFTQPINNSTNDKINYTILCNERTQNMEATEKIIAASVINATKKTQTGTMSPMITKDYVTLGQSVYLNPVTNTWNNGYTTSNPEPIGVVNTYSGNGVAQAWTSVIPSWGWVDAYAWTGNDFIVTGSGSKPATIYFSGYIRSNTSNIGVAGAETKLVIKLHDVTKNSDLPDDVYIDDRPAQGWNLYEATSYNAAYPVSSLYAGDEYIAYVYAESYSSVNAFGFSSSDIGPWNGYNGGVTLTSIQVRF